MKLLELNKNTYEVEIAPEAAAIGVFSILIKRDKSKNKEVVKKELAYIYHFGAVQSDYAYIIDLEERGKNIKRDLLFESKWKPDKELQAAIDYYIGRKTVNEILFESANISAMDISAHLRNTRALLAERTDKGAVVTDITKITSSLDRVPKIMANLNAAYQELVKEQKITEGRKKGEKELSIFEDGI
jgi:hypothetical protein